MKKLLLSASLLGAIAVVSPAAAEAKTSGNAVSAPQIRVQIGDNNRRRYNRRVRVVTTTRIVGRYRETIQTRYLPNGRTVTRVISRVRVNNNGWRNNGYRRG
jgi:hypothetical protein